MSSKTTTEFSRWRTFFWPVHRHELKKLLPMLLIFFLISFNYNVLRTMKDTVLITAKSSGAEVIPFIKVWVMFPMSVLMTYAFTHLCNRMSRERVFYYMISFFLAYFFVFTFILYPVRDQIHPHALADQMQGILPLGLKGLIAMFRYWTFTSFYVMSELWGNIVLFLLFWGFANEITKIDEAKRFYGLFGIGANFSGIAAGQISILICQHNIKLGDNAWSYSMNTLISLILVSGLLTMALFRWMNQNISKENAAAPVDPAKQKEKELYQKQSLRENIGYVTRSKYLICIATIVLTYNLVINLVEVLWKHEVRELYPDPNAYNTYMNQVTTVIGIISTFTALFVSGNVIRLFGWTFSAMISPIILLITSIGFFSFFFLKGSEATSVLGWSPLALVVFFGSLQNCLSRASKYTVFDATKELSFIPLSSESRIRGKTIIDGVCTRLGKSGGSIIHQSLLLTFSTVTASAPYVAFFLLSAIVGWIFAVRSLGRQFNEITQTGLSQAPVQSEPKRADSPTPALARG
ncbi:MAG: ntt 3 [Chlamydiales bacterium]|jgi:AAA family ATP:ADP antiporter|nr:ntt 3 [Chlamydiales bacterium]